MKPSDIIILIWGALVAAVDLIGSDMKVIKNGKYEEAYILRKGGISRKTKIMNGLYILRKLYIPPNIANRTNINDNDLLSYTICEKTMKELVSNTSSRLYSFILCPDENHEYYTIFLKDYCCFSFSTHCCNFTEFMNTFAVKKEYRGVYSSMLSVIGFFVFVIIISLIMKMLCGSRLRHTYQNMVIFTRRGGPPNNPNFQQTVVYPPVVPQYYNNAPMQPFLQYSNAQPIGQVVYGAHGGTGPYGSPLIPGQYSTGPDHAEYSKVAGPYPAQAHGQYPLGPALPYDQQVLQPTSHNVPQGSQPPPEYAKAILQ